MHLNALHTLSGNNGRHARFHAAVVDNVNVIGSARLVTMMTVLDHQVRVKLVEMETVQFLANGVSGVDVPRLVVVVELDLDVDFVQLAERMIVSVMQMKVRSVVKVHVHFIWNGLNGLIVRVLVAVMDAVPVIDSAHLAV